MSRENGNRVGSFLQHEFFYVVVLAIVTMASAFQTIRMAFDMEEKPALARLVTHQDYRRLTGLKATNLTPEETQAVAPYLVVRGLMLGLLLVGILATIGVCVGWVVWGRKRAAPLPPSSWGLWDVLKVAAVYAGGAQLFHLIFPSNLHQAFAHVGDWLAELFARILLAGTILYVATVERKGRLADLGIRGPVRGGLLVGAVGFLMLQPFLRVVEKVMFDRINPWPMSSALQAILQTDSMGVLVCAFLVAGIVTPIAEELFFRGYLQPALQKWVGSGHAILLGAAFFAVAHMDVYAIPTMLMMGIMLGYVYRRTRSLAAPILVHAAHNILVLLLFVSSRTVLSAVRP